MKHLIVYLLILIGITPIINAQEKTLSVVPLTDRNRQTQEQPADTVIPAVSLDEKDLDNIISLREQFEKQNSSYSAPKRKGQNLLRFMRKDKLEIPPDVLRMARTAIDASLLFEEHMTFKDTIIVNPIFLPLVFEGYKLPEEPLYDPDAWKVKGPLDDLLPSQQVFPGYAQQRKMQDELYNYVVKHNPKAFAYSEKDLPDDMIVPAPIIVDIRDSEKAPLTVKPEVNVEDVDAGVIRFIPDRLYWRSSFESAIQFSQSYVSDNWHKGGNSNLNLFTMHAVKYDYQKDRVQWTNLMELKIGANNAPNDTIRDYLIGDDKLRIHSNFGLKAFNQWYYTLDAEFVTQLFKHYKENTDEVQSSMLAPMTVNLGLGMKYELNKSYEDNKHKKLKLAINMAPISFTYMYSIKDDIDLGRHGFKINEETGKYETSLSQVGSTLRMDMGIKFNRQVNWDSRLYYSTSYDRVLMEFENTLTMAINRYFSTRIYLYLRFDDGVATDRKDSDWGYFQVNELLSFGFNYKW